MNAVDEPTFNRAGLGLLIALGLLFGAAFLLLSAYGPALKPGRDGGAHALSPAATGFSGISTLTMAAGLAGRAGRDEQTAAAAGLLVLTPAPDSAPGDVEALVNSRNGAPVLIVLPKWQTVPMRTHPGWVEKVGEIPPEVAAAPLRDVLPKLRVQTGAVRPNTPLRDRDGQGIVLKAPAATRTLDGTAKLDPVLADDAGQMVLGWTAKTNVYVLADPDLLNNRGLRDAAQARAAVRLLAALGGDRPGGVVFDVTLNGFGLGQSLLRTAFEPPFLALTLAMLIAGALAFWYGLMRFGAARAAPRAIAFGKVALVDNVAGMIRMAGREADVAPRYAQLVGEAVAARLHAPAGLDQRALAAWIEARRPGYAGLAHDAAAADGRDETLAAAQALYRWQEAVVP